MKVTVCIGSTCHMKGSRRIVEGLQYLIAENGLKEKIDLGGTFCMNNCVNGVCVNVDDQNFTVSPDTLEDFFKSEILSKV